jgi:hypothetical protein
MDFFEKMRRAEARRKEIRGLHAKHWTAREIADKFGITTQRVYAITGPFKNGKRK